MKNLFLAVLMVILAVAFAEAKTYKPITADDFVYAKEDVMVEETDLVEQKIVYTLKYINNQISLRQAQLVEIQAIIIELNALKASIDTEASKVKLGIKPVEKEEPIVE